MTTGDSTVIGSFPAGSNFDGYDNMFAFTNDGKQLYAAFPNDPFNQKVTTGSLYVMDTATGKIVEGPKTFKGSTAGGVKWGKGVGRPGVFAKLLTSTSLPDLSTSHRWMTFVCVCTKPARKVSLPVGYRS